MPDLILYNGLVWSTPPATAVAVRGQYILALGDDDTIRGLVQPRTRLINLRGRRVLPGLTDAHFHLIDWSLRQNDLDLTTVTSRQALLDALAGVVETALPNEWIQGQGWNESEWPHPVLLSRHELDTVSPRNPVILWRADMHIAVVNSAALDRAGITAALPNPPDGFIEKDISGKPTGILKELAIDLVSGKIPQPTETELARLIETAITRLHALGITGLHDQRLMSGAEGSVALRVYQKLCREKRLKIRLTTNIHHSQLSQAIALGLQSGFGNNYLRLGFVKMFADGSMGARTARMLQPYEDGGLGFEAMSGQEITQITRRAAENGWAVSIHAIGDCANREVLDMFEEVTAQKPAPWLPHRLEHAQLLHPADIPRLARLGVTASVQPAHVADDMILADKVWGKRTRYAYAFRSLLDSGALLALGSDCPVANPNPWLGIHAAVTRRRPDGYPQNGWHPAERLTVAQAVSGYTWNNARAAGCETRSGSLAPHKLADLVVVDQDIFTRDPMSLSATRVVLTLFDGKIVFSDDDTLNVERMSE